MLSLGVKSKKRAGIDCEIGSSRVTERNYSSFIIISPRNISRYCEKLDLAGLVALGLEMVVVVQSALVVKKKLSYLQ